MRNILVTGCSSGIGYCVARGLKERGYNVFATARKPEDIQRLEQEGFRVIPLELADPESVVDCVHELMLRTNNEVYAVFHNGAYGQAGALEDIRREVLEQQFAVNVFGWHQLTRACMPMFRANGRGRIVQCSSILGLVALKWRGAYNASKFALEALTDTMRLELRGTQIHLSLIEPGPITSRFTEHALKHFEKNIDAGASAYQKDYERQRARLGRGGSNKFKLPPEAVLEKLIHAVESDRPHARYYVTRPTTYMAVLRRLLPQRALDYVLDKASDQ